jgi:hypothetical protein
VLEACVDFAPTTAPLRAAFCAEVWRAFGPADLNCAAFFARLGFPTEAARRAFPGAAIRGCRDMKINTNQDDKRVSGMDRAYGIQGEDKTRM